MTDDNDKVKRLLEDAVPADQVIDTHDRLTARLDLYHEQVGENPMQVSTNYSHLLTATEQPWERRIDVGTDPVGLEGLWVKAPGMVLIDNRTSTPHGRQPTPEEVGAMKKAIVVVKQNHADPGHLVRPGRFMLCEPTNAKGLILQCQEGTARVFVYVYPS